MRLKRWQWVGLVLPIVAIASFLLIAAGIQIHAWGLNWIWAVVTLALVGWRWMLVAWTRPAVRQLEAVVQQVSQELEAAADETQAAIASQAASQADGQAAPQTSSLAAAEAALHTILTTAQSDPPMWEDWPAFWQRCQQVVVAIAQVYHPEVKYPLLNIYVPQAYALMRGTVDAVDQWMQKLSPVLNQVTVGQAYQAYEVYQTLEPSARKLWQVWNWAQWVLNPAAAVARQVSQRSSDRATQQLLVNLGQLLRETTLRNLGRQAIALYSSSTLPPTFAQATAQATAQPTAQTTPTLPKAKTDTLRHILAQAEPVAAVEQTPVNILLVGRTGAGKSSLINTLFQAERAKVDVLPSTDEICSYHWVGQTGESLTLWDTPGYEQVNRADYRDQVLNYASTADLVLLVTPALDPALQMDADFLRDMAASVPDLPVIAVVTQVDRLRPLREWAPPYDWQWGDRPKEVSMREATHYRAERLGDWCDRVVPLVTRDAQTQRDPWGESELSLALIEAIAPAKQLRLARFLRNLEARTVAAAQIIDHYTFQMTTTQGLAALLKSPVLQFLSTLSTGSPALAYALAEKIPVEQLPLVIGKLQLAYELHALLKPNDSLNFDFLALWPLLLDNPSSPDRNAWAFGHALTEYWTHSLSLPQLHERFKAYLGDRTIQIG